MTEYSVDDRGNIVQFYDESGDIIATLNREDVVKGIPDQSTWDAPLDAPVTQWAIKNGYPEIATLPQP